MIETALWGLSLLITAAVCFWVGVGVTAAVCFWVGVGVGRGESVPRERIMEICDTCPGRQEKYGRNNADSRL